MFQPRSVDGIGQLHQLMEAALAQWLTQNYATDPITTPPLLSVAFPPGAGQHVILDARGAGAPRTTTAVSVSAAGDTTVHTPAAGKTLTVNWVGLSAPAGQSQVAVTVKIGAQVFYIWDLSSPGAFSHWEPLSSGNANDALIVNLSSPQTVHVNFTYTEA